MKYHQFDFPFFLSFDFFASCERNEGCVILSRNLSASPVLLYQITFLFSVDRK